MGGAFYSFILQREQNLFFPQDPDGRRCGEGEAINYPFIYFPAPFVESLHNSVCVRFCPTDQDSLVHCLPNSLVRTCTYNITDHFNRSNQFIIYKTSSTQPLTQPTNSSDSANPTHKCFSIPSTPKSTLLPCSPTSKPSMMFATSWCYFAPLSVWA